MKTKKTTDSVKTTEKETAYNTLKAKAIFVTNGNAGLIKTAENEGKEDIADRRGGSRAVLAYIFAKIAKGRKIIPATEFGEALSEFTKGEKAIELLKTIRGKEGVSKDYKNLSGIARLRKEIDSGFYLSFENSEISEK